MKRIIRNILLIVALILIYGYAYLGRLGLVSSIAMGALIAYMARGLYLLNQKIHTEGRLKFIRVIVFIIIIAVTVVIQLEYIPPVSVVVKDPFGNPVRGITVNLRYDVGCLGIFSCETVYSAPFLPRRRTNTAGIVRYWPRLHFARPKIESMELSVNRLLGKQNPSYNMTRVFFIEPEKKAITVPITLVPTSGDWRECSAIADEKNRAACLKYSVIQGAIREKDLETCNAYATVRSALFDFYRNDDGILSSVHSGEQLRNACMEIVNVLIHQENAHSVLCATFELEYESGKRDGRRYPSYSGLISSRAAEKVYEEFFCPD